MNTSKFHWRPAKHCSRARWRKGSNDFAHHRLRHGYAVACIEKGIQLNIVQELLGHAQMTTTAIYAHAVGAERRGIVARLWEA